MPFDSLPKAKEARALVCQIGIAMGKRSDSDKKNNYPKAINNPKILPTHEVLTGTSRRVYRYIHAHGPVSLSEVHRGLGLSSSSVAEYHLQKLTELELIHQEGAGYVSNRAVFENMIRVRRSLIPLWSIFSAFLATSLIFLVTLLRPVTPMTPSYLLSVITITISLVVSTYETLNTLRGRI
jgi:DNA-binding transcriptional ArsR family regulator